MLATEKPKKNGKNQRTLTENPVIGSAVVQ